MPVRSLLVCVLMLAAVSGWGGKNDPDQTTGGTGGATQWIPENQNLGTDPTGTPATETPGSPAATVPAATPEQREQQLERQPQPDPVLTDRVANDYLKAGKPDDAERVLNRLIDSGRANPEAYRLRAAARFKNEDWPGTYADAQEALSRDPGDKVAQDLSDTARMQLNRLGMNVPDVKPAQPKPQAEEVGGGAPDESGGNDPRWTGSGLTAELSHPPGYVDPRKAFLDDVDRKSAIGGRQEAVIDLTRYLDKHPRDLGVLLKRARLLNQLKNPAAALADVGRVLASFPDDPSTLREEAYALIQLGRAKEALGPLNRAIALQPRNALGYLYRAMAYKALGDWDAALADYARAAQLDPALKGAYAAALAESGRGPKTAGAPLSRGRVRNISMLAALALLLAGLWGGARRLSGATTRGGQPPAEPAQAQAPADTVEAGMLLGGVYRIGRVLGRGGMGVVFEAEDLALERKVAIKQLRTPEGAPEDYARFLGEARLVAKLQHPNIVQIFNVVEEGGLLYLVFELVDGRGLDSLLAERGRLPLEETRLVLRDVAAALDCAHEARIIHRDLKPSNVMRTAKGAYKVMDFGIAHQAHGEALTRTGAWGTPPYMPPEQERGLVSKESDLYALGCTLYELLAGSRPFGAGDDKLTPRFTKVCALAPGLPPALDAFMDRALAPDPARRFHSGAEMSAAFEAAVGGRIAA